MYIHKNYPKTQIHTYTEKKNNCKGNRKPRQNTHTHTHTHTHTVSNIKRK